MTARLAATAIAVAIAAPAYAAPIADEYTSFFVLGDSLSDPGNLFAATGGETPPSPPYFEGRFSNGPVFTEYLAEGFAVSENFAFGGAQAVSDDDAIPDLPEQLGLPVGGPHRGLRRQRPRDDPSGGQRPLRGHRDGGGGDRRHGGRGRRRGGRAHRAGLRAVGGRGADPAGAGADAALHPVPARSAGRSFRRDGRLRRGARFGARRAPGGGARGHPSRLQGVLRRPPFRPGSLRRRGDVAALPLSQRGGRGRVRRAGRLRSGDGGAAAGVLRLGASQRHHPRGVRLLRGGRPDGCPGADPRAGGRADAPRRLRVRWAHRGGET